MIASAGQSSLPSVKGKPLKEIVSEIVKSRETGTVLIDGEIKGPAQQLFEFATFCDYSHEQVKGLKCRNISILDWVLSRDASSNVSFKYRFQKDSIGKVQGLEKADFLILSNEVLKQYPDAIITTSTLMKRRNGRSVLHGTLNSETLEITLDRVEIVSTE